MQSHIATLILAAMIAVRADAHDGVPQPDPLDVTSSMLGLWLRRIGSPGSTIIDEVPALVL
jgi:hypothetical protein